MPLSVRAQADHAQARRKLECLLSCLLLFVSVKYVSSFLLIEDLYTYHADYYRLAPIAHLYKSINGKKYASSVKRKGIQEASLWSLCGGFLVLLI